MRGKYRSPWGKSYLLLMIVYAHKCVAGGRMNNNITVCMPWDDGEREVRLDGLSVCHVDCRVDRFDELLSQCLIIK